MIASFKKWENGDPFLMAEWDLRLEKWEILKNLCEEVQYKFIFVSVCLQIRQALFRLLLVLKNIYIYVHSSLLKFKHNSSLLKFKAHLVTIEIH